MVTHELLVKAAGAVLTGLVGVSAYETLRKALGTAPIRRASVTVTWILRDLGVYAIRLSDDVPGFGLVMFGAIREASTLAAAG